MTPLGERFVRVTFAFGVVVLAIIAGLVGPVKAGQASLQKPKIVIAIDAGHGGVDPGAIAEGLLEKQVVLEFAKLLTAQIDETSDLRAFLIRADDSFLTLTQRIRRARLAGANLIVSLHADTTGEGKAKGAHVYTLSPDGTDQTAIELAIRENRVDVLGGVSLAGEADDLAALLVDLAQRGTMDETEKLATAVLAAMSGQVPLLRSQPHRRANFRILRAPEIPSILVELGYLSNPIDRGRMSSKAWSTRMAAALVSGIQQWATLASPGFLAPKK